MTHLATLALGIALGAAAMWAKHLRLAEAHDYRRIRLEYTRVDQLARQADSDHRAEIRWKKALDALQQLHRDIVGDLLDKVADRERTIRRLRRPAHLSRTPMPTYGRWRAA